MLSRIIEQSWGATVISPPLIETLNGSVEIGLAYEEKVGFSGEI